MARVTFFSSLISRQSKSVCLWQEPAWNVNQPTKSLKQISPAFSYFLINNALLYHFLANWLAQNKKMTQKSVSREALSPEMVSQSFPVSCFWSRGFVPHRKWNLTLFFWYIKTRGRKIAIENFPLLHISVHRGDLIEQIKNKIPYYWINWVKQLKYRGRVIH